MKKYSALIFAVIAWFAVIVQFYLILESQSNPIGETIIRFFSYFTILTNTLVACYFSSQVFELGEKSVWNKPGMLTAITVYIIVVGIVYQIVLRPIWNPQGLAILVDELLHSVNPLLVLWFWWLYEEKSKVEWVQVPYWLLYPFFYLIYILGRGQFSGFYPYPFMNVTELGFPMVALNSLVLFAVFLSLSGMLVFLGRKIQ
ncbi:Pr6Pr family membrane protein [Shivajiella indica]|uniref:Pr6Pr family membrane protein n=1 Tax=Shivajiella indica TaxID=872115 RepID=A0ABW5B4I7_9BACT